MKEKVVKSDHIVLDGTSRVDFIQAALAVHNLQEQYGAGIHSDHMYVRCHILTSLVKKNSCMAESLCSSKQCGLVRAILVKMVDLATAMLILQGSTLGSTTAASNSGCLPL